MVILGDGRFVLICVKGASLLSITPAADAVSSMPVLRWYQKLFYCCGCIPLNLCGSMWFTLLLVFFQDVLHIAEKHAGYLLMWGQVVNAICAPLIGYESDRINGCCGLPKRISWHLLGRFF